MRWSHVLPYILVVRLGMSVGHGQLQFVASRLHSAEIDAGSFGVCLFCSKSRDNAMPSDVLQSHSPLLDRGRNTAERAACPRRMPPLNLTSEGIRMVRSLIRNQMPGNRLRVRVPCPPLDSQAGAQQQLID